MKLEDALPHLRDGAKIWRHSDPDKGYFQRNMKNPELCHGSFYAHLWDLLADDWCVAYPFERQKDMFRQES